MDFVWVVENIPRSLTIRASHLDAQGAMPMAMCIRTVKMFYSKGFGKRRRFELNNAVGRENLWI
jgi:hypothetical protein